MWLVWLWRGWCQALEMPFESTSQRGSLCVWAEWQDRERKLETLMDVFVVVFLFWEKEIVKYIYLDGYWYRYIENFLIIWQFSHLNLPLLCRMKVYLILHLASNTEHAQWAHPLPAMLTRTIFQGITRELGRKSATDCVSIMRTQRKEGRKEGWVLAISVADSSGNTETCTAPVLCTHVSRSHMHT